MPLSAGTRLVASEGDRATRREGRIGRRDAIIQGVNRFFRRSSKAKTCLDCGFLQLGTGGGDHSEVAADVRHDLQDEIEGRRSHEALQMLGHSLNCQKSLWLPPFEAHSEVLADELRKERSCGFRHHPGLTPVEHHEVEARAWANAAGLRRDSIVIVLGGILGVILTKMTESFWQVLFPAAAK